MPIRPNIPEDMRLEVKRCSKCGRTLGEDKFAKTHSKFFEDGRIPWCHECVTEYLKEQDYSWDAADRLCMWADIPWIVKEWERLSKINPPERLWEAYSKVFAADDYISLGWGDYFRQYKKLKEYGLIEEELPEIREQKYSKLRKKWGSQYTDEDLNYLEGLYKGILNSQNVVGDLQKDNAQKICKNALEIEIRMRAGDKDTDKFVAMQERLQKMADFSPKNVKNASDFDSIAELALWVEKRGRQNKFYDGTTRDVIDETIKNIQSYNQRLYINEGGIGEAIENRIKSLQSIENVEAMYDIGGDFDEDEYDNEGFAMDEEFDPDGGE